MSKLTSKAYQLLYECQPSNSIKIGYAMDEMKSLIIHISNTVPADASIDFGTYVLSRLRTMLEVVDIYQGLYPNARLSDEDHLHCGG